MSKKLRTQKPEKSAAHKTEYRDFFAHTAELLSPEELEESDRKAQEIVLGLHLAGLRELEGKRQEDIPGFSQENVSRLERRADSKVSTCARYVESLDYELVLIAVPKDRRKKAVVLGGEKSARALRTQSPLQFLTERSTTNDVRSVRGKNKAVPSGRRRSKA